MNFFTKCIAAVRGGLFEDVSTSGRKLAIFDGLRGLAVLTVYLSHSSGFRQRLTPWTSFHGSGHLGVYLFFVLSAFLLGYTMLERGKVAFGSFYIRRFFRIAPLFYLIVTIVFAVQIWTHGKREFMHVDPFALYVQPFDLASHFGIATSSKLNAWAGYALNLIFIQGHSPFWTIPCEFQFYFVLPLLVWVLLRFRRVGAWAFAALAVGYGLWGYCAEMDFTDVHPVLTIIPHHSQFFDVFLFGLLAAWLYCQPGFRAWEERHRAALRTGMYVVLGLMVAVTLVLVVENFFGTGYRAIQSFSLGSFQMSTERLARKLSLLYGPLIAYCVLICACSENLLTRVARWRWLQIIGITGFSFYLIHFPMIRQVNKLFGITLVAGEKVAWSGKEPLAWVVGFALSFLAAIALYLCVEKPFMAMSRRFVTKSPKNSKADLPAANPAL